jgi:hypothetical protein
MVKLKLTDRNNELRNESVFKHKLNLNDHLNSPTGAFVLLFQGDGSHLVTYGINGLEPSGGSSTDSYCFSRMQDYRTPIWGSGTAGSRADSLVMQTDGNLVMYRGEQIHENAVWYTNTHENEGAFLRLQDDGNLVVLSRDGTPLWASGNNAGMK